MRVSRIPPLSYQVSTHTITTDPKPSARLPGWLYSYFDKQTPGGSQCVAVFSPALKGYIKKGFEFHEGSLRYDAALGASILELDFHEPQDMEGPSIPPNPEEGWGDPDSPLATVVPITNGNGHRTPSPHAMRKRAKEEGASRLPPGLMKIADEVTACFCMQYRLISPIVGEVRRADVAQKLTAIACIPYYRAAGVELSEDDVKGMTM